MKKMKILEQILLLASIISILVAGLIIQQFLFLGLVLLITGICLQVVREKKQSNIRGYGVETISVSDKPPQDPKKGDLWVETSALDTIEPESKNN